MRFQTIEASRAVGRFPTGSTVNIFVYDITAGAVVALTSSLCTEIGVSGVYYWDFSNLASFPSAFTQYLWIMDDTITTVEGEIIIGGYPDQLLLVSQEQNIIYVSNFGDNTNDGRSFQTPLKNIANALAAANQGDLIRIVSGIYVEDLDVTVNGVVIEGIGTVVLSTTSSIPSLKLSCSGSVLKNLNIFGGSGTSGFEVAATYSGNEIRNCSVGSISGPAVKVNSGASSCVFRNIISNGCDEGLRQEGDSCLFEDFLMIGDGASSWGYRILGDGNILTNCTSQNNPLGSFEIQSGSDSNILTRCIKGGSTDGAVTDGGTGNQIINFQEVSQISAGQSIPADLKSIYDDTQKLPTNPADQDDCLLIETDNPAGRVD